MAEQSKRPSNELEKENPKKETSDEYSEDYTGQTDKEYENDAFQPTKAK